MIKYLSKRKMILLLLIIDFQMAICAGEEDQELVLFAPPEYGSEDKQWVMKLKAETQALPPEKQYEYVIDSISRDLDKIQSKSLKAKCLISLNELYKKQGKPDLAVKQLERAFNEYSEVDMGLAAGDLLLSYYQNEFDYERAALTVTSILDKAKMTPSQDIHFSGRLGFFLAASRQYEEACVVVNNSLSKYPSRQKQVASWCEEVAHVSGTLGNQEVYYRQMKWIFDNIPAYATTPRFLGNFAHACQMNNKNEEAIKMYLKFIEEYPGHKNTASFLLEVGNLSKNAGDFLAAYEFYHQLLSLEADANSLVSDPNYLETLQELALSNLITIERKFGIEQAKRIIENSINEVPDWQLNTVESTILPEIALEMPMTKDGNVEKTLYVVNDSNRDNLQASNEKMHNRTRPYMIVAGLLAIFGAIVFCKRRVKHVD